MSNRVVVVSGHYRTDSGSLEIGTLVLIERNGRLADESGYPVRAKRYQVTRDISGVEIESDGGAWEFLPDSGECERIGLLIR